MLKPLHTTSWTPELSEQASQQLTADLEAGHVIMLPDLPFVLSDEELQTSQKPCLKPNSKNISFAPLSGELKHCALEEEGREIIQAFMRRFATSTNELVASLFPKYTRAIEQGKTSFRPAEVKGRNASYRKDDTRLHVDAFPSNPNRGKRILRVFSNVNPLGESRVWRVGEPFPELAKRFQSELHKPLPGQSWLLKSLGLTKSKRTPYDHLMLQLHNKMKANVNYQQTVPQQEVRFKPGMTWMVFTDQVSHAAMSGQFLLEQTYHLPVAAMQNEMQSPLRVLESLLHQALV